MQLERKAGSGAGPFASSLTDGVHLIGAGAVGLGEIGAGPSLVPRCAIPHRAEAADTQRSSRTKARGHVAKGHVARTAKVPINCDVNSLIIPDKMGNNPASQASDAG